MSQLAHDPTVLPIAYPLDDFYAQAQRRLPPIAAVPGDKVPEPYRTLLVHQNDMTPTLEKFFEDRIHLRVIRSQERGEAYYREVVLVTDKTSAAVEFGAIKINLDLFPAAARRAVLDENTPLGRVLADFKLKHSSRPKAFLKIEADEFITEALRIRAGQTLYGRRNTLFDSQQRPLAEIVEVLPKIPLEANEA
jgi:chorismate-pyruvate lyase